ncbi:MAG: hypothetical protein MZU95_09080 [Desulfomicrobium escambiense]|nr:hypothetical protein [Desulfomicrobium escambiense]
MDGRFVLNLASFGPKMIGDLRKRTGLFLDAHLMTVEPERLAPFLDAGADAAYLPYRGLRPCSHAWSRHQGLGKCGSFHRTLHTGLGPEALLPFVDLVLVMTVNPGSRRPEADTRVAGEDHRAPCPAGATGTEVFLEGRRRYQRVHRYRRARAGAEILVMRLLRGGRPRRVPCTPVVTSYSSAAYSAEPPGTPIIQSEEARCVDFRNDP